MTITLPPLEKDNQPPPPNPLNVLNLLLSKLKAMETTDATGAGEVTEVDVELCNKIYFILNPCK
ncbi:hypothetical protein TSAR_001354 [Trichomalopsis sarcophagae]|uniref:Uncharacterized protein n=1 Tax=Trichomalopsis sarcophagae TaxID=543379 RepID=A0A232EWB2_9HYME|nr:hypothetical protein TSAR_001354 [Trichomalopsis sarcophagae]